MTMHFSSNWEFGDKNFQKSIARTINLANDTIILGKEDDVKVPLHVEIII